MDHDTLRDSVAQLKTLADTLAARSTPAEQAAARCLHDVAAKVQENPGQADFGPHAAVENNFGPGGAMAGWKE